MDTFLQEVQIEGLSDGHFETVRALVDTGATYTCIPRPLLNRLGITPVDRQSFLLSDGRAVEYEIAQAGVRIGNRERFTICVLGEGGVATSTGSGYIGGIRVKCGPGK